MRKDTIHRLFEVMVYFVVSVIFSLVEILIKGEEITLITVVDTSFRIYAIAFTITYVFYKRGR